MKLTTMFLSTSAIFFASALYAEVEEPIQFDQAPTAVRNAILERVGQENIRHVARIRDEGHTKYEVESQDGSITRDITVANDGQVLEIETGTSFEALPNAAKTAIANEFPAMEIQEIESVQVFYFDVEGRVDGKTVNFRVFATGDIEDLDDAEVNDPAD